MLNNFMLILPPKKKHIVNKYRTVVNDVVEKCPDVCNLLRNACKRIKKIGGWRER